MRILSQKCQSCRAPPTRTEIRRSQNQAAAEERFATRPLCARLSGGVAYAAVFGGEDTFSGSGARGILSRHSPLTTLLHRLSLPPPPIPLSCSSSAAVPSLSVASVQSVRGSQETEARHSVSFLGATCLLYRAQESRLLTCIPTSAKVIGQCNIVVTKP